MGGYGRVMKFTEAQLESAIIELLGAEGYPHVLGEAIERQPQEVLIKADLRAFLSKQYAADHITPQEIEAVIKQLEAYSAADLYESNKAIMKLVSDGFLLKREDHTLKDLYIQLIDYSELAAFREPEPGEVPSIVAEDAATYGASGNIFKIVNQLEIVGHEKRIPDVLGNALEGRSQAAPISPKFFHKNTLQLVKKNVIT